MLMDPVEGDEKEPEIWKEYEAIVNNSSDRPVQIEKMDRMAFYERSKAAYAIIATSERTPYANIILKKGVL